MGLKTFGAATAGAVLTLATAGHASDLPARKGPVAVPVPPAITWIDAAISLKGVTDYNFRGISQTDRKPGIQGSVELQFYDNLFYAGVFGANVDLATNPPAEIDFYAGIRPKFGPVSFDLGSSSTTTPASGGTSTASARSGPRETPTSPRWSARSPTVSRTS